MRTLFALFALVACSTPGDLPDTDTDTETGSFAGLVWRVDPDPDAPQRSPAGPWTTIGAFGHVCLVLDDDGVARAGWFEVNGDDLLVGSGDLGLWSPGPVEQGLELFTVAGDDIEVEVLDEARRVVRWIASPRPLDELPPGLAVEVSLDETGCGGAL